MPCLDDTTARSAHKSSRSTRQQDSTLNRSRLTSARITSAGRNRSATVLSASTRRKRDQQNEMMQTAITDLISHFSHRNLEAIVRVIKATLEKLRRRITSTLSYGNWMRRMIEVHCFFTFVIRSTSSRSTVVQSFC